MRTSDVRLAAAPGLRHGRAQALLLLPLMMAGVCGLFPRLSWLVVLPVAVLYVLPETFVILAAATRLLAVGDAPGSGAVRRALAQLRGAGGQPKTVPPLLLVPVILLWEELLGRRIWFADSFFANPAGTVWSVVILAVGVALAAWRPRVAAAAAVLGTVVLLAFGGLLATRWPSSAGAAELRRIERDLHDGAQARLVAVGMSLRAAEQLMPADPEAAMARVAEARETSSRALDDLRDPARGTGLAGVERRLATFDGTLAVSSPPGGPTIIAIEIPYAAYPSAGGGLVGFVRSSWQTRTLI